MGKHVVASVGEIAPGGRKLVELEGRPIVVFNLSGDYFALLNRCPHQGGSLYHGTLTGLFDSSRPGRYSYCRPGEIVRCPWHAWEFDIRTGKSWCEPHRIRVRNYPVSVERGGYLIEGPYVAQTFPVSVEQEYVIVEV
jgi:nitrite reductase/ring-hydroxylating ferredoxin subunit